jgi:hypothetical protein
VLAAAAAANTSATSAAWAVAAPIGCGWLGG